MKAIRAQTHLNALQSELDEWLRKPYTVTEHTNFENLTHTFRIENSVMRDIIPMLLGDFICCLRSSLDQLAWQLAHLDSVRVFTPREERQIHFPIFPIDDSTYRQRLSLFPSAVADLIDTFQPYRRGNAFRDDALWQLNELWTLDKHRAIPMNSNSFDISFPMTEWSQYMRRAGRGLNDAIEVCFPLTMFLTSEVHLKPTVSVEILFGEEMGPFEVSRQRLIEINDVVIKQVIPAFFRFFT